MLSIFPLNGGYDVYNAVPGWNTTFAGSVVYYGTLPALTIIISSVGGWMLGMRNMMVSTLSEDYMITAEAKGLRPGRIMRTYAARNAILPSISGFAISLGERDPETAAIAAPVYGANVAFLGALGIVGLRSRFEGGGIDALTQALRSIFGK